ncbi:DUF1294 domain-containing protein [Aneurinibacillus sp. Ricciae_BoGa-3]|uniref:DUF1294 domain-containing protein n=1 Tax=Aneurinibacillus sp. Ricciae_BoGa-3 TaxID=3022697 RepID=UPI002341EA5B|nr:DUF1294 domain-containing protein [Aneurinibacillus sp. Ricciae_BoGa-3]WCK52539.1 DUF1294 domain-containing protein [Aneurinibacillus sp. Ricciae_BoGa-3]
MLKFLTLYLLIINLIGFYVMYADKQKAKRGEYRIREKTLWQVALLGGAPFCSLAMELFRHKTKHTMFKFGFPTVAIIQILCVIYIVSRFA